MSCVRQIQKVYVVKKIRYFVSRKTDESIALGLTFIVYVCFGALVLQSYEPEMDFFKALYFNFVTLTTIGLGDFVPKSYDYLYITIVYIGIGLALTTMSIEIAADLLKKIHYIGRKVDNVANTMVWFGGKKMTMKNLVKYLGDQFDIPQDQLDAFDLDQFVGAAIKVEAGEIKTLRQQEPEPVVFREKRAVSFRDLRKSHESEIRFADDRLSKITGHSVELLPPLAEDTARTVSSLEPLPETAEPSERDWQYRLQSLTPTRLIPRLDGMEENSSESTERTDPYYDGVFSV